jgi:hypothetical protein
MLRISEASRIRYEKAKRTIYHDKSMNDDQRSAAIGKALDRWLQDGKEYDAVRRKYDLGWERQEFRRLKAQRA